METNVRALQGKYPITEDMDIEDKISEQVSYFNNMGCSISFEYDKNNKGLTYISSNMWSS